ncbi:hypothetical protein OsJ_10995 [Oryza sativa Japonica Group]|uniref:Uncharacterized protein n=1 Tax=Oryza sativa subsp. japonica TaxID=39947 RepID=B9F8L9_ORYSJ|nr:hypothetical protein OsJ_10995 [Oryza sativa Japonica Group]
MRRRWAAPKEGVGQRRGADAALGRLDRRTSGGRRAARGQLVKRCPTAAVANQDEGKTLGFKGGGGANCGGSFGFSISDPREFRFVARLRRGPRPWAPLGTSRFPLGPRLAAIPVPSLLLVALVGV